MAQFAGIINASQDRQNYYKSFFNVFNSSQSGLLTLPAHNGYLYHDGLLYSDSTDYSDENIVIVVAGHISLLEYNDQKLSKVEIVKLLWEQHNKEIVNKISGQYLIFIYDKLKKQVVLFNSTFGMLPLYYAIIRDNLFFSTRLQSFIDLQGFFKGVDQSAALQFFMFNYILTDQSFVKNVKILPAASVISIENNHWVVNKYDTHQWLLNQPSETFKDSIDPINTIFKDLVNSVFLENEKVALSLTGGWDGRLLLSYIFKEHRNKVVTYTYGKKGHDDIEIAKKLAQKFDYPHIPVNMDEEFVQNYEKYAKTVILQSDGLRPLNRGHYSLMTESVASQSHQLLTGICGSNILKIVQAPGAVYNSRVMQLFKDDCFEQNLERIYKEFLSLFPFLNMEVTKDQFIEDILNSEIIQDQQISLNHRFYHYLLTNIERKYFGAEISGYANKVNNYSPFIDKRFVQTIVNTPYFGGHYPFMEKNVFVRQNLSKLYAHLMYRNDKKLAKFTSDRGFPVTWFLNPLGQAMGLIVKKANSKIKKKDLDPFNHLRGGISLVHQWQLNGEFFKQKQITDQTQEQINMLSWSYWLKEAFGL